MSSLSTPTIRVDSEGSGKPDDLRGAVVACFSHCPRYAVRYFLLVRPSFLTRPSTPRAVAVRLHCSIVSVPVQDSAPAEYVRLKLALSGSRNGFRGCVVGSFSRCFRIGCSLAVRFIVSRPRRRSAVEKG